MTGTSFTVYEEEAMERHANVLNPRTTEDVEWAWISNTPDGNYIIGEARRMLRSFYVAAGVNSAGTASAGGAGRALAEWINKGEPTYGSLAD